MSIKERIRNAVVKAANGSGLSRAEFSNRAGLYMPKLFAYMSETNYHNTLDGESLVRIALASNDPEAFMLSLLPPEVRVKKTEWTQADKAEALEATEGMAREIARAIGEAKRDDEAFNKLHSGFAACYLLARGACSCSTTEKDGE